MKYLITTFLCLLIGANLQAQLKRTLNQPFSIDGIASVSVETPDSLEVVEWSGTRILIEVTVELKNANKGILEALIKAERYKLLSEINGSNLHLNFKDIRKIIRIRDQDVYEEFSLKIFLPSGITLNEMVFDRNQPVYVEETEEVYSEEDPYQSDYGTEEDWDSYWDDEEDWEKEVDWDEEWDEEESTDDDSDDDDDWK